MPGGGGSGLQAEGGGASSWLRPLTLPGDQLALQQPLGQQPKCSVQSAAWRQLQACDQGDREGRAQTVSWAGGVDVQQAGREHGILSSLFQVEYC